MLIDTSELAAHRGSVAMVDGGFDPIHHGHIEYLERAAALGAPVLCNVAGDDWVARKHPPLLAQAQRGRVIDAIRFVDLTHLASSPTADVLELLRPRYYVKGADWRGRLPQEEVDVCSRHGVEIVFVDAVLDSSTALLQRLRERGG
jgi:cytidyltransferase-like protein